jgi:hypothetical protein
MEIVVFLLLLATVSMSVLAAIQNWQINYLFQQVKELQRGLHRLEMDKLRAPPEWERR